MSLKTFVDPNGTEWKAWEVPPRFTPLRAEKDRRSQTSGPRAVERRKAGRRLTIAAVERRKAARRVTIAAGERRRAARRLTIAPREWIYGWICFQSKDEKRRLCPLPRDWDTAPSELLEVYRQRAVPSPASF